MYSKTILQVLFLLSLGAIVATFASSTFVHGDPTNTNRTSFTFEARNPSNDMSTTNKTSNSRRFSGVLFAEFPVRIPSPDCGSDSHLSRILVELPLSVHSNIGDWLIESGDIQVYAERTEFGDYLVYGKFVDKPSLYDLGLPFFVTTYCIVETSE